MSDTQMHTQTKNSKLCDTQMHTEDKMTKNVEKNSRFDCNCILKFLLKIIHHIPQQNEVKFFLSSETLNS